MKKLVTIAAAVFGYLLIEVLLIFFDKEGVPEMLFIVSTAGMLAAFVWGSRKDEKKALLIVAWVISTPLFTA